MGEYCDHSSACIIGWVIFILSGSETNNKSLDEIEFRENFTGDLLSVLTIYE